MYQNKQTKDQRKAGQVYSQDGWIKGNLLRHFVQVVSEQQVQKSVKETEHTTLQGQQSWIPWPDFQVEQQ